MDVIPLFLNQAADHQIGDGDLIVASSSIVEEKQGPTEPSVCIQHIPTGITVHSAGAYRLYCIGCHLLLWMLMMSIRF